MAEYTVIVHGLPTAFNPAKLKQRFWNSCKVSIKDIKLDSDGVKIKFANKKDCQVFCNHFPKSISFGSETYALTLEELEQPTGSSAGESSNEVRSPVPKLHFDEIYTWTDLDHLLQCESGILVQPTDTAISPQEILEYFEDKEQSRGGPLEAIYPMADGIFLSFENDQVPEKVWNFRPHRIKGKSVFVYQKAVPVAHTHTLVVKPDDEKMTPDKVRKSLVSCSLKFIDPQGVEEKTKGVFRVLYSGTVEEQDVRDIVQEFKAKYPSYMISFLLKTDCVHIKPFPKDASNEELRTLFENKSLSSGGCVTAIFRREEALFVYFSSHKDAEGLVGKYKGKTCPLFGVCMKIYPYDLMFVSRNGNLHQSSQMKKFYDTWLRKNDIPDETTSNPQQEPLIYRAVAEDMLHFLSGSQDVNYALNSKLEGIGHGKVESKGIEIKLMKYDEESKKLAMEQIQQLLSNYTTKKVKVEDESTRCKIEKRMASTSSQVDVYLRWVDDYQRKEVAITGLKSAVESLVTSLELTADTESLKVKAAEMRWLIETRVLPELISTHNISCGAHEDEVKFKGTPDEVKEAKKVITEQLKMLKHQKFLSPERKFVEFLTHARTNDKIAANASRIMENSNVKAILFVDSDCPYIVGPKGEIATAVSILNRELAIDNTLQINVAELRSTEDQAWKSAESLEQEGKIMLEMNGDRMCIVGFREHVIKAVAELTESGKKERPRWVGMEYGAAQYVVKYEDDFTKFCSSNSVRYQVDKSGITITGQKSKVDAAKKILEKCKESIIKKCSVVIKHCAVEFFSSQEGINLLQTASSKYKSVVRNEVKNKPHIPDETNGAASAGSPQYGTGNSVMIGRIKLSVRQGDLTEETSDAILNNIGPDFILSRSRLSKAVADKGGPKIQEELDRKSGSVRITCNGKLRCKRIIHATFPVDVNSMRDCLVKVLKEAESRKITSISLPAIGTGSGRCDYTAIAKMFVESFCEVSKTSGKHLTKADIVILDPFEMIDFKEKLMLSAQSVVDATKGAISHLGSHGQRKPRQREKIGSLFVSVKQGDITQELNFAIVNSIGADFKLNHGQVSKAILQKGGHEIQRQVDAARGKLIRVTGSGNLACKKIVHVVTPGDPSAIKKCIIAILETAEDQQFSSISIPAIGTGNYRYSMSDVARLMITAIREFVDNNPLVKSLKWVDFVLFNQKQYQEFCDTFFTTMPIQAESGTSTSSNGSLKKRQVQIEVFSSSKSIAEMALRYVMDEIDAALSLVINDSRIDRITHKEKELLAMFEKQFDVKINSSGGQITIEGAQGVQSAKEAILGMLNDISQLTNQGSSHVLWEYEDYMPKRWQAFKPNQCQELEDNYQDFLKNGRAIRVIRTTPWQKTVDFKSGIMGLLTSIRRNGTELASRYPSTTVTSDPQNPGNSRGEYRA